MRPRLSLTVLGVASAAALGAAVHALAANPDKALVYCPVAIDSAGCDQIVATLSGPDGPFPGGVDRGDDGTAGTAGPATPDPSPLPIFIFSSPAGPPPTQPPNPPRGGQPADPLSMAPPGRPGPRA